MAPSDPLLVSRCVRVVADAARKAVVSVTAQPSVDLSWYTKATQAAADPVAPADIVPVIAGLTDMLKTGYFDEVNRLLKSFEVRGAATEMMIALLRTTFMLRQKRLHHWFDLRRKVRVELENRHLDTQKLLRGLF